jgi:hypothetical protein
MGGKSAPAPDYSAMARATEKGIEVAERLGTRQMDFAQRQYEELKPTLMRIAEQQMAAQEQQMGQAKDYYDYQTRTFRPVEQGLVRDAQEFSTAGYREQLARDAAAASAKAFGLTQDMATRAAAARGVNPNSGAGLAMQNQNLLGLSAQRANAMTGARTTAEQLGWARRMDAAGLGRGLAGASTAAYSGATGAGTAGANTAMAAGNQFTNANNAGVGTMMEGARLGVQGAGNILNAQTSAYNTGINAQGEMMGSVLGAGSRIGAAYAASDRRLKEDIKLVGVDESTGLNLYEFVYKGGSSTKYIGVMADEAKENFPHAVFTMPDGYDAVNYEALGIEFKQA